MGNWLDAENIEAPRTFESDVCIVGAGALVKQNQTIPDGSMAVGSPARVIRKLSEEEISDVRKYAERYVALQARYRDGALEEL